MLIDLTSLLDIVFILLLVFICDIGQNRIDSEAESRSMEAAVAEAEADKKAYSDLLETENELQKLVWSASIVVPYEPDKITLRHIRLLREGQELKSFDLVGNDDREGMEAFRACLTEYVEEYKGRPVILSLNEDDERILYRDERAIEELLDELSGKYDNVYLKGRIGGE